MKNSFLLIICLCVLFTGCNDDDTVPNRVIFTFTLKDPIFRTTPHWIELRDDDSGELIDSRLLVKNEPAVFESTKRIASGKLTVTFFRSPGVTTGGTAIIQVYAGVDVGSEFTWTDDIRNKSNPNAENLIGQYNLTINNAPALHAFCVSDKNSSKRLNVMPVPDNGSISMSPGFSEGNLKQIVMIDPKEKGKPTYTFLEDLDNNKEVVLDYNDFKEFDRYIKVGESALHGSISVKGYEGPATYYNGWEMYQTISDEDPQKSALYIGVLDELSTYRVHIYNLGSVDYNYLGPPPAEISIPTTDAVVTDPGFSTYKIQTSTDYNYVLATYIYFPPSGSSDNRVDIEYYSPKGEIRHHAPLSDELVNTYSLQMDKAAYFNTVMTLGTQTYSKLLDFKFASVYDQTQH